MENYKITQNEIDKNNVKSAADLLKGEPRDNKNIFDRLPELIATKLNGFIDAVISKFTDYYNKGEIDSKENVLNEAINTKANDADVYKKTETYTKEETNDAINEKVTELGVGDMAKSVYDTDGDGVVDKAETAENAVNAEKLNGQAASYYATKTEVATAQTTADNAMQYAIDNTGMVLLWENASPTSEFAPQWATVDLTKYKFVAVVTAADTAIARVGKNGELKYSNIWDTTQGAYQQEKRAFEAKTTGVYFNQAIYIGSTLTPTERNTDLIPLEIWGIK